jgi:menaquinone-9 beta-reductase
MKSITIAGGGLAGLALGIALRREGLPVTLWEAGEYPRHRVCGEFVSGRGVETLERLGVGNDGTKARVASSAAFFSRGRRVFHRQLPNRALCISRFRLDALLAERFCAEGGELRVHARWKGPWQQEGLVRASGRRVEAQANGFRWYGLKAHAKGVELEADLEMHFHPNAYTGLCRLPDGRVNVCGLFRRNGAEPGDPLDRLRCAGGELSVRLKNAEWDQDSVCAVAGLPPYPTLADGCNVGDALSMPAPVTGNGMSMAFESAEIAARPLAEYARGLIDWATAVRRMEHEFKERFATRLKWSGMLHRVLFGFGTQPMVLRVAGWLFWQRLFRVTR